MAPGIIMSSGAIGKNVINNRCRSVCIASMALCFICMLPLLLVLEDLFHMGGTEAAGEVADDINKRLVVFGVGARPARKLLQSSDGNGDRDAYGNGSDGGGDGDGSAGNGDGSAGNGDGSSDEGDMNRVGTGCSKNDITIFQGETAPLPNGIPAYTVQIVNVCVSASCSISDIHINCGWFSSAHFVNPLVFRRMDYNDCLVNDGQPLGPGQALSFQYANTFPYPLSVSSVAC